MVELAFLIGIFSFLVFGLGLVGGLRYLGVLGVLGILGIFVLIFEKREESLKFLKELKILKRDKLFAGLTILFLISAFVNLIGALGPELGFDALWYHLTIPKIYLLNQNIFFIKGGLFYYSAMPKLMEMIYLASLTISKYGILAKVVHWSFGVFCAVVLYQLSRKYLNQKMSLLTAVLFYTTLIVGWESITAYVDLGRTFFEILALKLFLEWGDSRSGNIKLYESGMMLGLAISTKLIAFASLPVFIILILIKSRKMQFAVSYLLSAVLVASPWLITSYIWTGNPVYPVFSGILDKTHMISTLNPIQIIKDFWLIFYCPQDFVSPVFLIFLPLIILKTNKGKLGVVGDLRVFVILGLVAWYFIPRTGGSRFLLPILPAFSLLLVLSSESWVKYYQKIFIGLIIAVAIINTGFRFGANTKFIAVLSGKITRDEFLLNNLEFGNNVLFDGGEKIKKIVKNDLVLITGSHNLFYADFPFIHDSYAPKNVKFGYLLTQNSPPEEKYGDLGIIFKDPVTKINLYVYGGTVK